MTMQDFEVLPNKILHIQNLYFSKTEWEKQKYMQQERKL